MTPEQQIIVAEALRLAKLSSLNVDEGTEEININDSDKKDEKSDTK